MMQKLKLHTPDMTAENVEKLADLLPACVTEASDGDGNLVKAIDFDQLRQELSDHIVDGPRERYHLTWPGKKEALLTANAPIAKTLRPYREESVDFDATRNIFVEGDNLDALKLFQETYLNSIDVIYIDPPYNKGNDYVYDDDFSETSSEFLKKSLQVDASGNRLVTNTESNGRFHSDWLSMIYPRLKLARNVLRRDGIIIISIDDDEVANLRKVADEIFGEENFIACVVWEKGRKNDAKFVSVGHDYLIIYAKQKSILTERGVKWREAKPGAAEIQEEYLRLKSIHGDDLEAVQEGLRDFYKSLSKEHPSKRLSRYNNVDVRGVWRDDNMSWPGGGGPSYDVIHPETKLPCKVPEGGWRYSTPEKMQKMIDAGRVLFREDHSEPPIRKTYLVRADDELSVDEADENGAEEVGIQVAGSYFYRSALQASNLMLGMFGEKVFNNPKDHEVLARWINYVTAGNKEALVLDFFAGSGTTSQSVWELNAQDGGKRRVILVQLSEPLDPSKKEQKVAAKFCDRLGKPRSIAEVTKERMRLAGAKILNERPDVKLLDVGFRVLKVDSSNMRDVYYSADEVEKDDLLAQVDNIREGRSAEDLLFQVLLDWGVDLSLPIGKEAIAGKTVYFVDGNALAACFDTGVSEELVKEIAGRHPLRVVFRDNGFASDAVKINVEQIFKLLSPETDVKSI